MRSFQFMQWQAYLQRATVRRFWARRQRTLVDYRDRISVVTWLLVFGLGMSLLIDLPTTVLSFNAFRSPISISLGDTIVAALFLAILAASGAESVIAVHPRFTAGRAAHGQTLAFWALPMALTIIAALLLPLAPSRLVQVMALIASGVLLALAFFCLYATVERGRFGFRRARLTLDVLAYGSALLLFLLVYQTNTRSLISGTLIAGTATLLAVELLRSTTDQPGVVLGHGAIVGLVLGQVTWALNYWPQLPDLTGGLLLLLIFYLLTGLAQQGLQQHLNRRVLAEFAIFTAVALVLIAVVGPGF